MGHRRARARSNDKRHRAGTVSSVQDLDLEPAPSGFWDRRFRPILLAILGLGVALRIGSYFDVRAALGTQFYAPILDSHQYLMWAQRIAAGEIVGNRVFFLNPLYAYVLAPFLWVVGSSGSAHLLVIRIFQGLLGLGTVLLVAGTARRLAGSAVALLAALLAATWPLLLYYEQLVMIVTLAVFANALALHQLARFAERPTALRAFLAGLPLGIALLARPNIGLFILVLPPWVWWLARAHGGTTLGSRLRFTAGRTALLAMAVVLPVAPTTVRNALVGSDFVPITYSAGINFWQANNPQARAATQMTSRELRFDPRHVEDDAVRLAERAAGRTLKPSEVSSYWTGRTLQAMQASPGAALRFFVRKLLLFLDRPELPSSYFFDMDRRAMVLLRWIPLSFGLLAPPALLGVVISLRRRGAAAPWPLLFGAYAVGLAVFFPLDHYRAPVLPAAFLLAAVALRHLGAQALLPHWRHRLVAAAQLLPCIALANLAPVVHALGLRGFEPWTADLCGPLYNRGVAFLNQEKLPAAEAEFRAALAYRADCWPGLQGLALLAQMHGDLESEASYLQRAIEHGPENPDARSSLAVNLALRGRHDEASRTIAETLRLAPRDEEVRIAAGSVHRLAGRCEDALREFDEAARLGYQAADLSAERARCLRLLQRFDEALSAVEHALAADPRSGILHHERALVNIARRGDPAQIADDLRIARGLRRATDPGPAGSEPGSSVSTYPPAARPR